MSYEIYKSIKQLENGAFEVVSSSNNVYPKDFKKWTMNYFNEEYPNTTNQEKRALWILYSVYSGDKFYLSTWKKAQKLACKFLAENNFDYEIIYKNKDLFVKYAKDFIKYEKEYNKKALNYKVALNGAWVYKKTTRRSFLTSNIEEAQVFKKTTIEELEKLFSGYNCDLKFIEA